MDFKKNLTNRTRSNGVGMLASNVVTVKRPGHPIDTDNSFLAGGLAMSSKGVQRPVPSSTPIRNSLPPVGAKHKNSVKGKTVTVVNGTSGKLSKAERQERLRKVLTIDDTSSFDSDENTVNNSVTHGPKAGNSDLINVLLG